MNLLPSPSMPEKPPEAREPRRVLLFEPGTAGHRSTILRYVKQVLLARGIEPVVRTSMPTDPRLQLPRWLAQEARREGAELVHVLTFDGLLARFLPGVLGWGHRFPIVATHYQYSNLRQGLRRPLLRLVLKSRTVSRLLISDPAFPDYPVGLRKHLSFIPDPWDPNEFTAIPKGEARATLGLASTAVVFLVFGDLSERKGLGTILRAFAAACGHDDAVLLLAGVPDHECRAQLQALPPFVRSRITVHFGFVAEEDVSRYFYAADYVVSSYPAWFTISSGTFTRACAAGKPMLGADHGVVGKEIRQRQIGLTHTSGNEPLLAANLRAALTLAGTPGYDGYSRRARALSGERTLAVYGAALLDAYHLALEPANRPHSLPSVRS